MVQGLYKIYKVSLYCHLVYSNSLRHPIRLKVETINDFRYNCVHVCGSWDVWEGVKAFITENMIKIRNSLLSDENVLKSFFLISLILSNVFVSYFLQRK